MISRSHYINCATLVSRLLVCFLINAFVLFFYLSESVGICICYIEGFNISIFVKSFQNAVISFWSTAYDNAVIQYCNWPQSYRFKNCSSK